MIASTPRSTPNRLTAILGVAGGNGLELRGETAPGEREAVKEPVNGTVDILP